ncbi:la protein [Trichuris trichiura]|uniref:La protein n=1 Tax=Trichuris trichiura TaxID=36087 RepID=A0A077YZD7_TRITR|nr:la protein [Trichuris trichiura]
MEVGAENAEADAVVDQPAESGEKEEVAPQENASPPAESCEKEEDAPQENASTPAESCEKEEDAPQENASTPAESCEKEENAQKEVPEADKTSILHEKILKQYYFSDINFVRDKFLIAELAKNDDWLKLDTLMTFGRVKALSNECKETVVNALKSRESQVIEFNEEMMKIRRLPSLRQVSNTPEFWLSVAARSAVVSGFPKEATLDEVIEFCRKYGNVDSVSFRKTKNNEFWGSTFVAFANREELEKFLAIPSLNYNGAPLEAISEENFKAERAKSKKRELPKKDKGPGKRRKREVIRRKGVVLHINDIPHHTSVKQIHSLCSPFGTVEWVDHRRDSPTATVRFAGEENTAAEVIKKIKESPEGQLNVLHTQLTIRTLTDEEEDEYWQKLAAIVPVKADNDNVEAAAAATSEDNKTAENSSERNENELYADHEEKKDSIEE